jgi:pSer/pThr/pTyr-binding forkhead associated (FHA) protein
VCSTSHRFGDQVCQHCGHLLTSDPHLTQSDDTGDFSEVEVEPSDADPTPIQGNGSSGAIKAVVFEIEGRPVPLPDAETLVVGRAGTHPIGAQPDVDLTAFGAFDKGVSRCHLRLKRRGSLLYVADIGSANGTLLNGRRLLVNGERLLRDGDLLYLSRLRIKVRVYQSSA